MATSLIDADSLLAIDVGSINTRASLFDVVDGSYRFLASGSAPTTAHAPYFDIGEGIRMALDRLQSITGRTLVGADEQLIVPSKPDGSGVDSVCATLSVGQPLKVVAVGLLEDVSLESVRRLASSTYARLMDTISLTDRRKTETRMDTILRIRPDLILVAGGTEGGASQSVLKLLESIGLACYLMPQEQRPEVLFAGNQDLKPQVQDVLGKLAQVSFAPNVRPTLTDEDLEPAIVQLASIFRSVRSRKMTGVQELDAWAGGGLIPTSTGFGRVIRFLSRVYDVSKGVLGIDVGAFATTLAAAFSGELFMGVHSHLGMSTNLAQLMDSGADGELLRWLHLPVSPQNVRDYLHNKSLFPASLPATAEDLDIEQAIARQLMRAALLKTAEGFPSKVFRYGPRLTPWFEPIFASGAVITQAPSPAQSMLMLLDGLQPTGVTTVAIDYNHILPSLGAAAAKNPVLAVQVLEPNTFVSLGTVISPVSEAKPGTPILRVRMVQDDNSETALEIKQGTLEVLHLPMGKTAKLDLRPLQRTDVGMGAAGRGGGLRVVGGVLGVVIDARGRPLRIPDDPVQRRETLEKWRWALGI